MVNKIPLTGFLVPGVVEGYVVESKYIQGTYIVVKTIADRDALCDKSMYEERSALVDGSPVYVSDERKTYRYEALTHSWREDTVDLSSIEKELEQLKLDFNLLKSDVELLQADLNNETSDLKNKLAAKADVSYVNEVVADKQKKLIAGDNITILQDGTISANISAEDVNIQVDKSLDTLSENPIANKVVANAIADINNKLDNVSEYNDTELRNLINNKVDKIDGKGLSSNDFTDAYEAKLNSLKNYDDSELRNEIEEIKQSIPSDLGDYVTVETHESDIAALSDDIKEAQLDAVAEAKSWVADQRYLKEHQDISHLETKEDAADKLAEAKAYTDSQLSNIDIPDISNKVDRSDLDNYYTKAEIDSQLDSKVDNSELSRYATQDYVDSQIESIPAVDSYDKATVDQMLSTKVNKSEIEDVVRVQAMEEYVQDQVSKKVDYVEGKQLSTEDYTTEEKNKLASLENYDDSNLVSRIDEIEEKIPSLDNYYNKEETDNIVAGKADKSELFSKDYNDLINKPEIPSVEGLASEQYVQDQIAAIEIPDISNKADRSELFSGDYNDLTNKPEIPSVEGLATETFVINKIAEAELGGKDIDLSGYATKDDLLTKADKEHSHEQYLVKEDLNDYAKSSDIPSVEGLASEEWVNNQGFLKDHQDISHLETKEDSSSKLQEAKDYTDTQIGLIKIPDVSGKADKSELESYYTKEESNQLLEEKANKSELFSGSYDDLTNKPEIPSIEGLATTQWVEEQQYLKEHQDISGKLDTSVYEIDKQKTDEKFAGYVTKEELENKNYSTFDGDYNSLTNKPNIPSVEGLATEGYVQDQVSNKVDTEELESYYDKSEVDSLLQNKADSSSVYTKEEVDQKFENIDTPEAPTSWNADEVFFEQDLIFTEEFGKYTPDSTGSVTIPTKTDNMSLQDLLLKAFSEEKDPVTTQPTIVLASSNIGSKEVGTKISVQYSFTDATVGSYSYGPETGVTWSDYSAKFNGETVTGLSGTFAEIQVTDDTNLSITGTAKHSAGATPKTNLGNPFTPETITGTSGAIQEETVTKTKGTLTGYRKMFMGTMTTKPETLTSSDIRGLTGISQAVGAVTDKTFTIPVGAFRVVCAVPEAYKVTSCKDKNGFDTDLIATGGMTSWGQVEVEGLNGYSTATYDVWYQDFANANDTVNTYKVTVKKD